MDKCTGENSSGTAGWELRNKETLCGQQVTQTAALQPWIAPYRKPEAKHCFWGLKDLQCLERANEGQEVENDSHNSSS